MEPLLFAQLTAIAVALGVSFSTLTWSIIQQRKVARQSSQTLQNFQFQLDNIPTPETLNRLESRILALETQEADRQQKTVSPFFYQNIPAPQDHLGERPQEPSKGLQALITETLLFLKRAEENEKYQDAVATLCRKMFPTAGILPHHRTTDPFGQDYEPLEQIEIIRDTLVDAKGSFMTDPKFLEEFLRDCKRTLPLSSFKPITQLQVCLKQMISDARYHALLAEFYGEMFPGELVPTIYEQKSQIVEEALSGELSDEEILRLVDKFNTLHKELRASRSNSLNTLL